MVGRSSSYFLCITYSNAILLEHWQWCLAILASDFVYPLPQFSALGDPIYRGGKKSAFLATHVEASSPLCCYILGTDSSHVVLLLLVLPSLLLLLLVLWMLWLRGTVSFLEIVFVGRCEVFVCL